MTTRTGIRTGTAGSPADGGAGVPPGAPADGGATLTVGEVAREAGVAPSAVRFYEQHGVIRAERTAGNQRRFGPSAPCILRVAKVAQRAGMTVREIADAFAELPEEPAPEDWGRFSRVLVAEAERRVAALRGLLGELGSDGRLCELPA